MSLSQILRKSSMYIKKKSPLIFTLAGSVGVVATAVLAAKAAPKAMKTYTDINDDETIDAAEYIKLSWRLYIPTALTGAATIACIFWANVLSYRQQAAIASAYIMLERTYKDYKDRAKELYGPDASKQIHGSIIKEKYDPDQFISRDGETFIFYEEHYGNLFERTMLDVQIAEYNLNRKLVIDGEATVNDFLRFLNLDEIEGGDIIGWSIEAGAVSYNYSWIDFEHELIVLDDGMECYCINTVVEPSYGFRIPF